jgi:hypothetical protein
MDTTKKSEEINQQRSDGRLGFWPVHQWQTGRRGSA